MEKLRQKLLEKGVDSFKKMATKLRIMDRNNSNTMEVNELKNLMGHLGLLEVTDEEVHAIFKTLDKDNSGSLDTDEFMKAITPPLSQARKDVIAQAFKKADKTGDGLITQDDLKGVYNVTFHPDFKNKKKTEAQLFVEYLNHFEPDPESKDGRVTLEEFEKYYAGVSVNYDTDKDFVTMMTSNYGI